jgi:uncharacterized protein (DUF2461 family)
MAKMDFSGFSADDKKSTYMIERNRDVRFSKDRGSPGAQWMLAFASMSSGAPLEIATGQ